MDALARPIRALYDLSHHILATSVKDLTDADAHIRARADAGPSIAWTIGHLCHYKVQALGLLGHPKASPFAVQFDRTAASDGGDYPRLAALLESFAAGHRDLRAALDAASAAQLDAPMPGAGPHDEKRVLDTLLFLAWHEAYHIGSIGAIRKALGRKAISELVTGQ